MHGTERNLLQTLKLSNKTKIPTVTIACASKQDIGEMANKSKNAFEMAL